MNRLIAFGIVCLAAILFLLVAYSKLSEDGVVRRGLMASSTKDALLDENNLDSSVQRLPTLTSKAEVLMDVSSSDLSSSIAEVVEDIQNNGDAAKEFPSNTKPQIIKQGFAKIPSTQTNVDIFDKNTNAGNYLGNDTGRLATITNTKNAIKGDHEILRSEDILNEANIHRENDGKPIHIIVLARMRTGSSLVGEIFNQNPSIFYIFEPLHAVDSFIRHHPTAEARRPGISVSLLSMLAKCQFTPEFINSLAGWPLGKSKSSGLLPICQQTDGCRRAPHQMIEQRCHSFGERIGMKTIRADLKMLQSLVEKDNINLKIIHLIRDPRGTANSRRSFYGMSKLRKAKMMPKSKAILPGSQDITLKGLGLLEEHPHFRVNTIVKYCKWMSENIPLARSRPPWLENRYMLVRYEDLALDPVTVSKDIYKFVGLTMPANIQQWVFNNTNVHTQNSGKFSMHKNSREVMQSWRHSLPYQEVLQVQEACRTAMKLGGYREVNSPGDLEDMSYETIEKSPGQ